MKSVSFKNLVSLINVMLWGRVRRWYGMLDCYIIHDDRSIFTWSAAVSVSFTMTPRTRRLVTRSVSRHGGGSNLSRPDEKTISLVLLRFGCSAISDRFMSLAACCGDVRHRSRCEPRFICQWIMSCSSILHKQTVCGMLIKHASLSICRCRADVRIKCRKVRVGCCSSLIITPW